MSSASKRLGFLVSIFLIVQNSHGYSLKYPYTADGMVRSATIVRAKVVEISSPKELVSRDGCYVNLVKATVVKAYEGKAGRADSLAFITAREPLAPGHEYVIFLSNWHEGGGPQGCPNSTQVFNAMGLDPKLFLPQAYVSQYEVLPPNTLQNQGSEFFLSRRCDDKFDLLFGGRVNRDYPLIDVPSNLFKPEQCKYRAGPLNILEERIEGLLNDKH